MVCARSLGLARPRVREARVLEMIWLYKKYMTPPDIQRYIHPDYTNLLYNNHLHEHN